MFSNHFFVAGSIEMFSSSPVEHQIKVELPMNNMFSPSSGFSGSTSGSSVGPATKGGYSGFDNKYSTVSHPPPCEEGPRYQIKTMCLAKKTVRMPTKEEHGFLLFCGLGARKWSVPMDCSSLQFKQQILHIYPRLRSVIGYNLWTLTHDKKTFERIPESVNAPVKIREYLGERFTGCMIIVPVSDIVLMEEKREHLRQQDIRDSNPMTQNIVPAIYKQKQEAPRTQAELLVRRSLCLICGKIEKTPGTGVFHKIHEEALPGATDRSQPISKKLTDILGFNFEQSRKKFIASNEICRKCLRTVCELVKKEEEIKSAKEELVTSFFSTTSKFNKHQTQLGMAEDTPCPEYQHPFTQRSLPRPLSFISQSKSPYTQSSLVQFYRPNWKGESRSETASRPGSPQDCKQDSAFKQNSYCGSDIASSSYLSVSPPGEQELAQGYRCTFSGQDTESTGGRVSPRVRDCDARSYASTFSLNSTNSSMRSKGQTKAYDSYEQRQDTQRRRTPESQEERERAETEQMEDEEEQKQKVNESYNPTGDNDTSMDCSTNQDPCSPSQSSNSFASDSIDSNNQTRPCTPEEEKAKSEAEAEVERRKPWKKRKRAIESDLESNVSEEIKHHKAEGKGEDSTSTSASSEVSAARAEGQLDLSISDQN